ncbi:MAG: gamma carbonic anhydrase family protein [Planctomycetes bacterium]|nr:gamma carbonic anhydrase family protein [Planctomycetota bacterium]
MLYEYLGKFPFIHESVYITDGVRIIGDVEIGRNSSVWFNTVIRGDVQYVKIGERTNIQDMCMIHVTHDTNPTNVGDDVSVGHSVTLHGCTLKDKCLIGMGSIVLDDAIIPSNCLVAAGSLVPPRFTCEPGMLIMGQPAKAVRPINEREQKMITDAAKHYINYSQNFRQSPRKEIR